MPLPRRTDRKSWLLHVSRVLKATNSRSSAVAQRRCRGPIIPLEAAAGVAGAPIHGEDSFAAEFLQPSLGHDAGVIDIYAQAIGGFSGKDVDRELHRHPFAFAFI